MKPSDYRNMSVLISSEMNWRWIGRVLSSIAVTVMTCLPAAARDASKLSRLFVQYKVKEGIVKPAKGLLKQTYLVPSGHYFPLFDWDTYFIGVALSDDGAS